tara:strand:+ start:105 stop:935 length:831 start_codon:yes stop_codon:yes gene_type:complete
MPAKNCLITGATSGIGLEISKILAQQGYDLILVSRSESKLSDLSKNLEENFSISTSSYTCDLSSMHETIKVASIIKTNHKEIYCLMNNAGGIFMDFELTEEGFEKTFALNHMSYYIVTNILLDNITSRIINIASEAHRGVKIREDFQCPTKYNGWKQYKYSKLANIYFTYHLNSILNKENSHLIVNCLHPGVVNTNIANNNSNLIYKTISSFIKFFAISSRQGATTPVYLATSSDLDSLSGAYFIKSKPVKSSNISYDKDIAEDLWKLSNDIWKSM